MQPAPSTNPPRIGTITERASAESIQPGLLSRENLDRFYNEFAANPAKITEQTRVHYARLYSRPGSIHAACSQFAALPEDAKVNRQMLAGGKLATPVLAIGGDHSYGTQMADIARAAFTNVQGVVIPGAGHWIMEEQPPLLVAAIRKFLGP